MTVAKNGDTVSIDYTVRKGDGTPVVSTEESGPQDVVLGSGELFPQVEAALAGMEVGAQQSVAIDSADAFGPHNPDLVADLPRANMPTDPAPQPGMQIQAQAPDGEPMLLTIIEVGDDTVKADANHPLAGEDIIFDVTLREIKQAA